MCFSSVLTCRRIPSELDHAVSLGRQHRSYGWPLTKHRKAGWGIVASHRGRIDSQELQRSSILQSAQTCAFPSIICGTIHDCVDACFVQKRISYSEQGHPADHEYSGPRMPKAELPIQPASNLQPDLLVHVSIIYVIPCFFVVDLVSRSVRPRKKITREPLGSIRDMWHFLDLNHDQKLERRRLLDLYGSLAQVSALIPLTLLQLYFLVIWFQRRWLRKHDADAIPSSPHLKKQRLDAVNGPAARFQSFRNKTIWWMGDTLDIWGSRVTKGEIAAGVVWTAWLIFLSCVQTQGGMLCPHFRVWHTLIS